MTASLQPATIEELAEAVRSSPCVLPVGGGTKPRLSGAAAAAPLSLAGLNRILEYDPSEFTFTAQGGTPLRDIGAALAERGQHLPFDLVLAGAGATLGGTVAAGLSGSGRLRFGGLRDFILAVRFVDGSGRVLRMGGKVVKNAASTCPSSSSAASAGSGCSAN
jgi:glycolate oxidase FAD binding subunit